jgi:transposase InsO family protein
LVLQLRDAHPAWGGRKLQRVLLNRGHGHVPAPSTITRILQRHGRIAPPESAKRQAWQRFERNAPNELWQMDFKGEFKMSNGRYCYPLTVLDDHSRYSLGVRACGNQQRRTVKQQLITIFRRYGLPGAMLMDNGTPWGMCGWPRGYTKLKVWLLRLDVPVSHARPYHPQTQGKEERFHRTMNVELLQGRHFDSLRHCQGLFDPWRDCYNLERPHEALGMQPPVSRYRVSERSYPEQLPELEYGDQDAVRKVNAVGQLSYKRITFKLSEGFAGQRLGIRATCEDGCYRVYLGSHCVGQLDMHNVDRRRKQGRVEPIPSARCARDGDRLNES